MTNSCKMAVDNLNYEGGLFADLTVEQLLYAAIAATSKSEVEFVLRDTNWEKWVD